MKQLDDVSTSLYIRTETGSIYHYDTKESTLARLESTHGLRRDGEALRVLIPPLTLEVGKRATFLLEPLGEGDTTIRTLSVVQSISTNAEESAV